MSRAAERGVALVAATVALALVSLTAIELATSSVVEQRLTRNMLSALQADALARSGVAMAAAALRETAGAGVVDTADAPWLRPTSRQHLGAGWIEIRIEDEARRLSLAAPALAGALARLFARLGLAPDLRDALSDWTDADDERSPRGAERAWYAALDPPLAPANRSLRTLGELHLVRGFSSATVDRLRAHVTVVDERGVNPNTASVEVLSALAGEPVAGCLVAARRRAPIAPAGGAIPCPGVSEHAAALFTPRSQHYRVRVEAGAGAVRRTVEAVLWLPAAGLEPRVVAFRGVSGEP